jgi:Uma2 family endonuclease
MNSPAHVMPRRPAQFTKDEFLDLVGKDAFRKPYECELVEGELIRMNAVYIAHQRMADHILITIKSIIDQKALGLWVIREPMIDLGPSTIRQADVAVTVPLAEGTKAAAAADTLIAIEVADTTLRTDLGEKLLDYASAGIPEYLVVDLNTHVTHVCRQPKEGDYAFRTVVPFGTAFDILGTHALVISKP